MTDCPTCDDPRCRDDCCTDCGRRGCLRGCVGLTWRPGKKADRDKPAPAPAPRVKPCKKCGGTEFRSRPDYRTGTGCRYCIPCRRDADRRYRERNVEKRRGDARKFMAMRRRRAKCG